ncbi:MAG: TAXI family TRAP transporter solute-binding subunit [Chloroflexota bacterium]
MQKNWRRIVTAVVSVAMVIILVALFLPGCAGGGTTTPTPGEKTRMRFAGLGVGGFIYTACVAAADLVNKYSPNLELAVEASVGSILTPRMIEGDEVPIAGGSNSGEYASTHAPNDNYQTNVTKVRRLAVLATSVQAVFCLASKTNINSLSDLAGKKVGLGSETSPAGQNGKQLLEVNGITAQIGFNTDLSELLDKIRDGIYDAAIHSVAHPWSGLLDLASTQDVKFIPLTDAELQKFLDVSPSSIIASIPANVYPKQTQVYKGIGGIQTIDASSTLMSEAQGYEILKILDEHFQEFQTAVPSVNAFYDYEAWKAPGVPLHAGAIKWLKEKGVNVP